MIIDDRGRHVEGELGVGPFREGDSLTLECNVPGGKRENERAGDRGKGNALRYWVVHQDWDCEFLFESC